MNEASRSHQQDSGIRKKHRRELWLSKEAHVMTEERWMRQWWASVSMLQQDGQLDTAAEENYLAKLRVQTLVHLLQTALSFAYFVSPFLPQLCSMCILFVMNSTSETRKASYAHSLAPAAPAPGTFLSFSI